MSPDPERAFQSSHSPSARSDVSSDAEDFDDFRDDAAVFFDGLELLPWPSDDDVFESTCVASPIFRALFIRIYLRLVILVLILFMRSSCSISGSSARRMRSSKQGGTRISECLGRM